MPRGPRNRIAKVFILEGRTGSGERGGREERRGEKFCCHCAAVRSFVLSSFQFNVKEREFFVAMYDLNFTSSALTAKILIVALSAMCGSDCEREIASSAQLRAALGALADADGI